MLWLSGADRALNRRSFKYPRFGIWDESDIHAARCGVWILEYCQCSRHCHGELSLRRPCPCVDVSRVATFPFQLNTTSAVQANKIVLSIYNFTFPVCLTWFHSIMTALGMLAMAAAGVYTVKQLPFKAVAPVSLCYVGFIVFNNLSIKVR